MKHKMCSVALGALAWSVALGAGPGSTAWAQIAPPATPQTASQLDEIVVTARRRNERIQDTPVSIAAFTSQELSRGDTRDFKDILRQVPGVSYSGAELGQSRYNIRGVSTTSPSPTVGVFIDDISLVTVTSAFSGAVDPVFFDFARVEVLKGPQGTLYGGSAMGGAIKYISQAPDLDTFSVDAAAGLATTAHGGVSYQGEAVVNAPVIQDRLAIRAGVLYREDAGYVDNVPNAAVVDVRTSITAPPTLTPLSRPSLSTRDEKDQNANSVLGLRLSALWKPDDVTEITPSVFHQSYRQDNTGAFWTNLDGLKTSFRLAQPTRDDLTVYGLTAVRRFDKFDITSLTGYIERDVSFDRDYSYYIATLVPPLLGVDSLNASDSRSHTFSQELRIASSDPTASVKWTAGLYYSRQTDGLDQAVTSTGVGALLGTGTDIVYHGQTSSRLTQYAAFADVSFKLSPRFDATVGVRYFDLKQSIDTRGDGVLNGGATHGAASTNQSGFNPRFELSYRAAKDSLIYTSAAKGFRPGGGNPFAIAPGLCQADLNALGLSSVPVAYQSDKLWTYELGSKNQFLNRRLTINGAAFLTDWSNIQQNVFLPGCGFSFSGNVGAAEIKGAELTGHMAVTDALSIGASAGYTDAKITKSAPGVSAQVGQEVLDTPKWIASGYVAYRFPVWGDNIGTVRADYQYHGSSQRMFESSLPVVTPTGPVLVPNPTQRQEAYEVVNLNLDIDTSEWRYSVYVTNLFDVAPLIDHNVVSGMEAAITLRPRTLGVNLRRHF